MIELGDIRSRVVTLLQDNDFTRWSKTELNNYIHDALLDLIRSIRLPSVNNSVTINDTSYLLGLPASMMDVNGGSIEGRELPIVTTSEMKSLSHQGRLPVLLKQGEYSVTQIFGNPLWNPIEDWTTITGTPQSIVLDQKSSSTIRIWPIPTEEATVVLTGTLRPFRMSDQVPYTFTDDSDSYYPVVRTITTPLNGWNTGDTLIDDTGTELIFDETQKTLSDGVDIFDLTDSDFVTNCEIDYVWVDALTFGAVERAYLKEHDLRNVEKSEYFRNKKVTMIAEAHRIEPINPASIAGGINLNRFIVRR